MNAGLWVLAVFFAIGFLWSLLMPMELPPPDQGLIEWTKWIGSVVGILVVAKGLWAVADRLGK